MIGRLLTWGVVLVLTLPILWLVCARIDVPLSPEAKAWDRPEREEIPPEANAYYAIIGFYAQDPSADINRVGQSMQAEYLQRLQAEPNLEEYKYRQERPVLGKPNELCEPLRMSCLQTSTAASERVEQLERENSVLLRRYYSLYRYSQHRETEPPHFSAPLPSYVGSLHHLVLARIALQASGGQQTEALEGLARDTAFWRMVLGGSHHLVGKAVATHMVLDDEQELSDLLASSVSLNEESRALVEQMLHPLSDADRDLGPAMEREFRIFGDGAPIAFSNGLRQSKLARAPVIVRSIVTAFLSTAIRPNHTKNLLQKRLAALSTGEKSRPHHFGDSFQDYVYNPLGKYFVYDLAPTPSELSKYGDRLDDLDGLIRLVTVQWHIKKQGIHTADIPEFLRVVLPGSHGSHTGELIHWDAGRKILWLERRSARPGEKNAFAIPYAAG
jgi:hypothetical protein